MAGGVVQEYGPYHSHSLLRGEKREEEFFCERKSDSRLLRPIKGKVIIQKMNVIRPSKDMTLLTPRMPRVQTLTLMIKAKVEVQSILLENASFRHVFHRKKAKETHCECTTLLEADRFLSLLDGIIIIP